MDGWPSAAMRWSGSCSGLAGSGGSSAARLQWCRDGFGMRVTTWSGDIGCGCSGGRRARVRFCRPRSRSALLAVPCYKECGNEVYEPALQAARHDVAETATKVRALTEPDVHSALLDPACKEHSWNLTSSLSG